MSTLLQQFRTFNATHYPDSMETLIAAFAVFGGSGMQLDIHRPLRELIIDTVLDRYDEHYQAILSQLPDDPVYNHFLNAIARGDRRLHSACRRARIGEARGQAIVSQLRQIGILDIEPSREPKPIKTRPRQKLKREIMRHRISHKLRFRIPFQRFMFRFVIPFGHEIEKGEYSRVLELFSQQHTAFTGLVFEELSQLYLRVFLYCDPHLRCGSYWDRLVELDILARVPQIGIIVGECKWTNTNVTRAELTKLEEKCAQIGLHPDRFILFSKRGFSNELRQLSHERLLLVASDDLKVMLE